MRRAQKNRLSAPLLAMTAALVLAPAAGHAATAGDISALSVLNTSPLWADSASYWACNVVNVSTSTFTVTIDLIGSDGSVVTSGAVSLAGGTSTELTGSTTGGFARCRFSLDLAPTTIRANLTVFHEISSGVYQTYAISEAR